MLSTTYVATASRSSRVAWAATRDSASSRDIPRCSTIRSIWSDVGASTHDHGVEGVALTGLGQQRDVVYDDRTGRCLGLDLGASGADPWMDDRLEDSPPVGVGEDDRTHGRPVEIALGA